MSRRQTGDIGEQAVCDMLIRHGYEILDRNFTVRGGEIDIIAKKNGLIAFVEVKTRKHDPLTSGEDAINYNKKKHLIYAAQRYLDKLSEPCSARFDVAVAEHEGGRIKKVRYYVSAFDASK
ncbi:YraN family protein [Ruminococcus sp. NK3A76]|uniref:YraN family protein n=1 Tax=Ruminococcus sp. NK3A76 TaxID=877411 RepID=UPI00048C7D4E|nr:YraN family protein [Ruminococcus sp. NK3A76]